MKYFYPCPLKGMVIDFDLSLFMNLAIRVGKEFIDVKIINLIVGVLKKRVVP